MRSSLYPDFDHLPAADPAGLLQPPGCAARTFTGTSFDLCEIVNEAARVTCGLFDGGYPVTEWQLGVCDLRQADGTRIPPSWSAVEISAREGCACLG